MYLSFYNLKVKPFQMSTDPDFLWLGEQHKEALATLKYAIIENKGVLALTGDVGTGKTTLINALIQSLGEDTMAATIYDPSLGVLEFFNVVATAFEMGEIFESKGQFIISFRQFLRKVTGSETESSLDHRRSPGRYAGTPRRNPPAVEPRTGTHPAAEHLFCGAE